MIRTLLILTTALVVSLFTDSQGQVAEMDTVFVKRSLAEDHFEIDTLLIPGGRSSVQVLAGTTLLPYSSRVISLLNHGITPLSLDVIEECANTSPSTFHSYPQFLNISRDVNELIIDVKVIANCCHTFLGEAQVLVGNTLNLIYTSYGGFCSCDCAYVLRYSFNTSMEKNYQVLKYVTINNDKIVGHIPNNE